MMRYAGITSPANPLIKETVRLKGRRGGQGAFLVEGPHLIEAAVEAPGCEVLRVFFSGEFSSRKEGRQLLQRTAKAGGPQGQPAFFEVPEKVLSKLSDTKSPQGVVAVVALRGVRLEEVPFKASPFLVVCDGVQDPGNLGTIIRVADAADADAVVCMPGTCDPFSPKVLRSTAGSLFHVPVLSAGCEALAAYCDANGIQLCVTDVRAETSIYEHDLTRAVALVFGSEAHGASGFLRERAARLVRIPIPGRAESLNVATAASICLYEAVRQRRSGR